MVEALEEIARHALDSEQLRQLGRGNVEGGAGLEAGQDEFEKEVRDIGKADEPAANAEIASISAIADAIAQHPGSPPLTAAMLAATTIASDEVGPTASCRLVPNNA